MEEKKHKKKHKKKYIGSILLLLIGISALLVPVFTNLYYNYQYEKAMAEYQSQITGKDYSDFWEYAHAYNEDLLQHEQTYSVSDRKKEELWEKLNPMGNGLIGYVDIDKINVHLPIFQGTEEKYLQSGSGWWLGTSFPTDRSGTKSVITAHNGLIKAKMFTDIGKLKAGDTFYLTIFDKKFEYEVRSSVVIEPSDFSHLEIRNGDHAVILYTCTPYGVNTHRLLVEGQFVREVPFK